MPENILNPETGRLGLRHLPDRLLRQGPGVAEIDQGLDGIPPGLLPGFRNRSRPFPGGNRRREFILEFQDNPFRGLFSDPGDGLKPLAVPGLNRLALD